MAELKVDTQKLKECGQDIMNLMVELNEVLFSLYDRIEKMPGTTREWTGNAAVKFVNRLNVEKKYYLALKDNLHKYGKILYDSSNVIEQISRGLNQ